MVFLLYFKKHSQLNLTKLFNNVLFFFGPDKDIYYDSAGIITFRSNSKILHYLGDVITNKRCK